MATDLLLPSLTNLPAFYAALVSALLLLAVSAYALLFRGRAGRPAVRLRTRVVVLLPAWLLWATWAGFGVFWLGFAGLLAGSLPIVLLAAAAAVAFLLWTLFLAFWLRGRTWADAVLATTIVAVCGVAAARYPIWICEPLGHSGLNPARHCAARLYADGGGGAPRDPRRSLGWYRQAAADGDAEAQYLLGTRAPTRAERAAWLEKAAAQRHGPAAYALFVQRGQRAEEQPLLQLAVDQGHPDALYRMGRRLAGLGPERDLARARELVFAAAEAGSPSAVRYLALAYAGDGVLVAHDAARSAAWERKALELPQPGPRAPADERAFAANWQVDLGQVRARMSAAMGGDGDASQAIARELLRAAGDDPELLARGHAWLERAAEAGEVEAQYAVADYLLGLESANDAQRTRGRAWLLAAADAGHRDALRRVVAAYRTGADGIARDLEQARWYGEQWLAALQAAGVQHNQAPWMRASWDYADTLRQLRRERERYLPPDELERAVRAGDAEARYHRARELMREDFAAGVALLEQAADGGFAEAQYHAARRVRARKSPPDALRRALDWLRSAAQSGHRGALYELGTVYAQGVHEIGLAPDPAQARSLFERALDGGGEELYRYADAGGRGWIVTAHQVRRWLERLPE